MQSNFELLEPDSLSAVEKGQSPFSQQIKCQELAVQTFEQSCIFLRNS